MKKIIILFGLLCCTNITIIAQQFLIYQEYGKVSIVNYESKIESELYQDYRFKEKTVLENKFGGKFVGYNWANDSLSIFLEKEGIISYLKFEVDSIKKLLSQKIQFERSNVETILKPNKNPFVTWEINNIKLVSNSGNDLKCYIDSTLIWTKRCRIKTFSCFIVGGGIWNPKISQNGEKILVVIDGNLTEVDIKTGVEMLITKKSISNYDYSQNGRYVKYIINGEVIIYDKITLRKHNYETWSNAFWIYK